MIMDFHPFTARRAPIVTDAMSTRETSRASDKVNDRDRIDDTARAKASETPRAREETRRARSGEDVEIARDDAHADAARASTPRDAATDDADPSSVVLKSSSVDGRKRSRDDEEDARASRDASRDAAEDASARENARDADDARGDEDDRSRRRKHRSSSPEPIGEDPAVTAARNAAAAGPSREELERRRAEEDARRAEEDAANAIITRTLDCPQSMVGRIIGRAGETIKSLQASSGAHVAIDQNVDEGEPRKIVISGAARCVDVATELVENLLLGTGVAGGLLVTPGQVTRHVECPKESVGKIIGRGGETIRGIQMATGARLQIDQTRQPCQVVMAGNEACVDACVTVVKEIIEGGSTAVFNEIARGGQGFGGGAWGQPQGGAGGGGVAYGAPNDAATYAQQQAMYAQMYAQMGYTPDFGAQQNAAAPVAAAVPVPAAPAVGANPWRAIDDGKGNIYYYNALTGVSQWEKPDGFA